MENFFKVSFLWILLTLCLYITLPAHAENDCGISIPTEAGNLNCEGSTITWDDAGSADIIDRNSSCAVAITDSLGNGGPYTWSVSGTGLSLTNAVTTGLSNTLIADGAACGSATITVTGCAGTVVNGYVRCIVGKWVSLPSSFHWPYEPFLTGSIVDKYRITGIILQCAQHNSGAFGSYGSCDTALQNHLISVTPCCDEYPAYPDACTQHIYLAPDPAWRGTWPLFYKECYGGPMWWFYNVKQTASAWYLVEEWVC